MYLKLYKEFESLIYFLIAWLSGILKTDWLMFGVDLSDNLYLSVCLSKEILRSVG